MLAVLPRPSALASEEDTMKRPILLAGVFLTVGIVLGASCARGLSAQQSQTRFTELLRAELAGIEGKEAVIGIAEIAPGAKPGRHYHPGDEFFYLLEGSFTWAEDGMAPHVVNAGDLRHQPARRVAEAKDITAPVRALVFLVHEKGQPLRVAVEE
jgi:quercetin dioxygenase-like cupin family protein